MRANRNILCILIMILCLSASVRVSGADSASWKARGGAKDQASSLSKELVAEIAIHRVLPGEEGITADYRLKNQGGKGQKLK